jgi:hypothetical protein
MHSLSFVPEAPPDGLSRLQGKGYFRHQAYNTLVYAEQLLYKPHKNKRLACACYAVKQGGLGIRFCGTIAYLLKYRLLCGRECRQRFCRRQSGFANFTITLIQLY